MRFAEFPEFQILERISLRANIYLTPIRPLVFPNRVQAIPILLLPHLSSHSAEPRLFDVSHECAFECTTTGEIRLKAMHWVHIDVVESINRLEAILFPTCVCTRSFQSWSPWKWKFPCMRLRHIQRHMQQEKIDWFESWFKIPI